MADIGIFLNCASKKEHVPEIEIFNLTTKERVQSSRAVMPFKKISTLMIVHIVTADIFWVNISSPSKPGAGLSYTKETG